MLVVQNLYCNLYLNDLWNSCHIWHSDNTYKTNIAPLELKRYCLIKDAHLPLKRRKETCRFQMNLQGVDRSARWTSSQAPKARQKMSKTPEIRRKLSTVTKVLVLNKHAIFFSLTVFKFLNDVTTLKRHRIKAWWKSCSRTLGLMTEKNWNHVCELGQSKVISITLHMARGRQTLCYRKRKAERS